MIIVATNFRQRSSRKATVRATTARLHLRNWTYVALVKHGSWMRRREPPWRNPARAAARTIVLNITLV